MTVKLYNKFWLALENVLPFIRANYFSENIVWSKKLTLICFKHRHSNTKQIASKGGTDRGCKPQAKEESWTNAVKHHNGNLFLSVYSWCDCKVWYGKVTDYTEKKYRSSHTRKGRFDEVEVKREWKEKIQRRLQNF